MSTPSQAPQWTRGWEAIVDAKSYPELAALLAERGAAARDELERLLGHFWQDRARRHAIQSRARLVIPGREDNPILVQTIDVSQTGALVSVPFGNEIDVMTATGLTVLLPVRSAKGPVQVCCRATLVRMAGLDDRGVRVGLRFESDDRPSEAMIASLREVTSASHEG